MPKTYGYGRQYIDENDISAVADGFARRFSHLRPEGKRV